MRIVGRTADRRVWIDGLSLDPSPSCRVWNHSPDGFNWGYAGSGPAQMALAILLHAGVSERRAVRLHQSLKVALIQHLPQGQDFDVTFDLHAWLDTQAAPVIDA